jgi:DNA repair protein RecN (Recombination protein N)
MVSSRSGWLQLSLQNLGVIDSAELELGPGFTVITGETGAGKTMVVTALGLLRGERADFALVRSGADQARVEASVQVPKDSGVSETVETAGGQLDDDVLILGRTLTAQDRSRAFAGGATVPAGVLADLTDELVAVHGQSDQHRLLRPAAQRLALDAFAGDALTEVLSEYEPAYSRLRSLEARLFDLHTHEQERARELDQLRHGLTEIEAVEPTSAEDIELAASAGRLAHADSLVRAAELARIALHGDGDDLHPADARSALAAASAALGDAAGHDPVLDGLSSRLRDLTVELDDVGTELAEYASGIESDPGELARVQSRIAELTALKRKYGPELEDVIAWSEKATARVAEIDLDDDAVAGLEAELESLRGDLDGLADRMHGVREEAASRLVEAVTAELTQLSMPSAQFSVDIRSTDALGPHGRDEVEFRLAANSGLEARPLAKGASGGELSRVMLALEVVLADQTTVPTLVFDEVDAGIGGKAAVEVGRRLARLAEHAQVLAVTHLPQVAAFADHHFRVLKDDDGHITSSTVVRLDSDVRVDELARMLAGQEDSASAQEHARELLALAGHS